MKRKVNEGNISINSMKSGNGNLLGNSVRVELVIRWNPHFLNPRILKLLDNSKQKQFSLNLLYSYMYFIPDIS